MLNLFSFLTNRGVTFSSPTWNSLRWPPNRTCLQCSSAFLLLLLPVFPENADWAAGRWFYFVSRMEGMEKVICQLDLRWEVKIICCFIINIPRVFTRMGSWLEGLILQEQWWNELRKEHKHGVGRSILTIQVVIILSAQVPKSCAPLPGPREINTVYPQMLHGTLGKQYQIKIN